MPSNESTGGVDASLKPDEGIIIPRIRMSEQGFATIELEL